MRRLAAVFGLLVLAAVCGQLVLPGYAEKQLRDDLRDSGEVRRVEVSAFPALKLLSGRADKVTVRMGEARAQPGKLADLLVRTGDTDELDASAESMQVGPVVVRDLRLDKDGDLIKGEASVTAEELTSALPFNAGVRPIVEEDGSLVLEVSAGVLGTEVAVRARLSVVDGNLVIAPEGLLGGFASLTVFSDPRIEVRSVGARETADGYTFTASARLRS